MGKYIIETMKSELLQVLARKGITNQTVLRAMDRVPRERFVHVAFSKNAYHDAALPIGQDQTISQPFTVAFMTQELDVHPGHTVLEVGTGSGYQAAILSELGAKVVSIERQETLYNKARQLLYELNANVQCELGDGSLGCEKQSPFDRIIVTAGAPEVPRTLMNQLVVGGKMIVPVGNSRSQQMFIIERSSHDEFSTRTLLSQFSFVPLLGEEGWKNTSTKLS